MVFSKGEGSHILDPEGNKYIDFLSAYSAVNQVIFFPGLLHLVIECLLVKKHILEGKHVGIHCFSQLISFFIIDVVFAIVVGPLPSKSPESVERAGRKAHTEF